MDTDVGHKVRWLLLDCKLAGIDVEVDGDNLKVRGSQDRDDLYGQLKEHKDDVVWAMNNVPDAVETHYLSRLRKGREWLYACMERLSKNTDDDKLSNTLVNNIMKWALIDDELRRLYPEFRGCVLEDIGGCDNSYTPVRCNHCADIAREKNDNQNSQR